MTTLLNAARKGLGLGAGAEEWPKPLSDDLAFVRTGIVNLLFFGPEGAEDRGWVLIDAGIVGSGSTILQAAARRFGPRSRPSAIVLTHGHFDHVGALRELADRWDVPVFAHRMELPYLDGRSNYPPPDPTVGGGLMASLSWLYPKAPINLGDRVKALPSDGSVPGMDSWRWIHTPGHTFGHVSFFRDADRTLIAGDAFITTKQESALAVLTQEAEIHGPPMYFTPDWPTAWESVRALAALEPELAVTGHGLPMSGEGLRSGLHRLAQRFAELAIPEHGRYVGRSAMADDQGVSFVPPDVPHPMARLLAGVGIGLLAGVGLSALNRRDR